MDADVREDSPLIPYQSGSSERPNSTPRSISNVSKNAMDRGRFERGRSRPAQVIEKNTLGLDGAKRVIAAAAAEARRLNASGGVIAVGWAWRPRSSNL